MPKVYNGSPALPVNMVTPWEPMNWFSSNNDLMTADYTSEDNNPEFRDDFDEIILGLPDQFTGINMERVPGSSYERFNYFKYPEDATANYAKIARRINKLRPELDFVFYLMPQGSSHGYKRDDRLVQSIEREMAYREASQYMKRVGVSAYWRQGLSWEDWRARRTMDLAYARYIHKKEPVAFVWDLDQANIGWSQAAKPRNTEEMTRILDFYKAQQVDVVYWSHWGESHRLDTVRWETLWPLYKFATS